MKTSITLDEHEIELAIKEYLTKRGYEVIDWPDPGKPFINLNHCKDDRSDIYHYTAWCSVKSK